MPGSRCSIAIVGPTACGKTSLAIAVAREIGGEIISTDSRQAYRGFRVGTAAPNDEELAAAPHHGVGILEPDERYGAGRFVEFAEATSRAISGRGNVPILTGGTGLFLRALTHPMFCEPEVPARVRDGLRHWIEGAENAVVTRWAQRLDPTVDATSIDPQRAGRTVELALASGRPLSWWIEHGEPSRVPFGGAVFLIETPSDLLRERIAKRARGLLDSGAWEAEVRGLEIAGHQASRAFDALGYRDVQALVHGRIDRATAYERIFAATWAYARRQRTWFRHQLPETAVRLDGATTTEHLSRRIRDKWRTSTRLGPTHPNRRGTE
ncbi:MAG: tRNA (adenosine(37)-N6)-dimethylallyltransferase MiaA [Gemmatimonadota bacterium]